MDRGTIIWMAAGERSSVPLQTIHLEERKVLVDWAHGCPAVCGLAIHFVGDVGGASVHASRAT